MLRITKMTDYAILVIGELAKGRTIASATTLAASLHLNVPTVSKVLKILSAAGFVRAIRGAEGGYCLNNGASDITLADIVTAMDGKLAMTECCEQDGLCTIDSFCVFKENWKKINKAMHALLSQWTIKDMLTPL